MRNSEFCQTRNLVSKPLKIPVKYRWLGFLWSYITSFFFWSGKKMGLIFVLQLFRSLNISSDNPTISTGIQFSNSKKNRSHGNYMRKYSLSFVNLVSLRDHNSKLLTLNMEMSVWVYSTYTKIFHFINDIVKYYMQKMKVFFWWIDLTK